jgi:predicted nucleic acid-binding protein
LVLCCGSGGRIASVIADCFVLDSSAVLTLIEDEAGADRVEDVLRQQRAALPWVVLMEVYDISQQEQGQVEAERRHTLIKQLFAEILWNADEPTILLAGDIKAAFRLSFADSLIAAIARQRGAVLLHKDPELDALAGQQPVEALPYKPL